jgi:Dolichyl-phosphate-mannose-protein mannosyltransferase
MSIPHARAMHDWTETVSAHSVARYLLIARFALIVALVTCPLWLGALFFTSPRDYSISSSLVCIPLLVVAGILAVAAFTRHDTYLRRLMFAGLWVHIAASGVFLWVGFVVYGGIADAFHYWTVGLQRAEDFQILGWAAFPGPYWSTNLISNICGVITLLIGDALPTLFIVFTLVSLAGAYLFYRAFEIAFPNGDRWLFGLLVTLLPSLLFWSSFVGKDALIQFFIALTCFGFAKVIESPGPRGVLLCAIGLGGALLVRAHIASMLAIAITFPYAVGRSRAGAVSKAGKIILIPLLAAGTYLLIRNAGSMIDLQTVGSTSMVEEANTVTATSQVGGSAFNQGTSLPIRIAESPLLLFRPFPWEVHNLMGIATAVESVGWLCLCWFRRREIWWTMRHFRDPYIGFLLVYTAVFMITFGGAISNFGILLRQRIMLTPLALMVICAKAKPLIQDNREPGKDKRLIWTRGKWRSERITTQA